MLVAFDVLSQVHRHEARVISAVIAGRKVLSVNAGHLMFFGVILVVDDAVHARALNLVAGFIFSGQFGLLSRMSRRARPQNS